MLAKIDIYSDPMQQGLLGFCVKLSISHFFS